MRVIVFNSDYQNPKRLILNTMRHRPNLDNTFQEGTIITAKCDPALKLVIMKYYQRIYYCSVIGDASSKQLTYFERELIPPSPSDN